MAEEIKCPHCNSNNVQPTGVVLFSEPKQVEFYCFSCRTKFIIQEAVNLSEVKHQPDLKGCFNCLFYQLVKKDNGMSMGCTLRENQETYYTDTCNNWRIIPQA